MILYVFPYKGKGRPSDRRPKDGWRERHIVGCRSLGCLAAAQWTAGENGVQAVATLLAISGAAGTNGRALVAVLYRVGGRGMNDN